MVFYLLVSLLFESHRIWFREPVSVHQGAQCDRASIALNYARVNADFLEPRVMETGTRDGITPCEFPIVNYIVSLFYRVFGVHPFWYRFFMWCITGLGLWAAMEIAVLLTGRSLAGWLIAFTWYSGTVLTYYTSNFLPDTASLSLLLIAFHQWLNYQENPDREGLLSFILPAALAGMVKITSLLFIIALGLVVLVKKDRQGVKAKQLLSLIPVFLLPSLWLIYCKYLEQHVGGSYFLMSMAPPANLRELGDWFHVFYANWFTQIYSHYQWWLLAAGVIFLMVKASPGWFRLMTFFSLLGVIAFYLLMSMQFRYHDYYVITLLPLALFLMVQAWNTLARVHALVPVIVFTVTGLLGWVEAKNNLRLRYTPGSYWYQTFFEPDSFRNADSWLTSKGIGSGDKILAYSDPNPNALLYFLKRRGYRASDHPEAFIQEKLGVVKAVVLTDTSSFFRQYPSVRDKITFREKHQSVFLYSIR